MNFPTITIPDPAAVGKWLDEQVPSPDPHRVSLMASCGWVCFHWITTTRWLEAEGNTPEELLADIRAKLAELDPLAKLRKDAESHGYALMKLPTD